MANKPLLGSVELKNLGSADPTTRIQTFRQVELSLKNNIMWAEKGSDDENTLVSIRALLTHLFRWFKLEPLLCEGDVLDLLIKILSRPHFVKHATRQISVSQMMSDMLAIAALPMSQENIVKAQTIIHILEGYAQREDAAAGNSGSSNGSLEIKSFIPIGQPPDFVHEVELQRRLQMHSPTPSIMESMKEANLVYVPVSYENKSYWEKLLGIDLEIFRLYDQRLCSPDKPGAVQQVLATLRAVVFDYPPEFFLQPPQIIESLINLVTSDSARDAVLAIHLIRYINNGLKERWPEFLKAVNPEIDEPISIANFLNRMISMMNDFFERLLDNFDAEKFDDIIPLLNEFYQLVYDVAVFIKLARNSCDLKMNSLLNMMAKVTKEMRLSYLNSQKPLVRLHYLIFLHMMNVLLASIDLKYIYSRYRLTDWEIECDLGLLDVSLMISYPRLFSLIKTNRWEKIHKNPSLTLMMDARAHWRPVVQIFQGYKKMSDEEVIIKGHRAICTIRIHQSLELVALLFNKIHSAAEAIERNDALKSKSQEIVLRLLSNELDVIRRYSYLLAHQLVKAKNEEGVDDLTAKSLTTVFGIPITVEIVTEILCFGLEDEDETVRTSSQYILFMLLRSKMFYASNFGRILSVIRPVLPLLMCLTDAGKKNLGTFVFDVYEKRNGFDDFEINKGLARFLYTINTDVRTMAKKMLLNNLQIPGDIVEIVNDNFCILTKGVVTELIKPTFVGGFTMDAYKTAAKILCNYDFKDPIILKKSLMNLSTLMSGSLECCLQAHKDNVWVPFMLPEFNLPNDLAIRKYVIDILYSFTVSINELRVYYASKPEIFTFLIQTLIYYQEHEDIKKKASIMLFLILFSDYVVNSEVSFSMAKIIGKLCCPFTFHVHWEESPFNSWGLLEQNRETENTEDFKKATERCMRHTFALEWFHGERNLVVMKEFDYNVKSADQVKPLTVHNDLQMNRYDLSFIEHTHGDRILENFATDMSNATNTQRAQELINATHSFLKLPFTFEESHIETLRGGIDRLAGFASTEQRRPITGLFDIYRRLLPQLSNRRVQEFFTKRFVFSVILNAPLPRGDLFVQNLKVINAVVLECGYRPELMNMLITNFDKQHKMHLPSRIIEKIMFWLTEATVGKLRWQQETRRPELQQMLALTRNVLRIMPIELDAAFLGNLIFEFVNVGLSRNRFEDRQRFHFNSGAIKNIFGIAEAITARVTELPLHPELYRTLCFWSGCVFVKNRSPVLMTIANLTKSKKEFTQFATAFTRSVKVKLFQLASVLFQDAQHFVTPLELKAASVLIGNILEFDPPVSICGYDKGLLIQNMQFLQEKNNYSALCFIVRKLVSCNTPGYVEIIKKSRILQTLLLMQIPNEPDRSDYQLFADQFETITMCYEDAALEEFVREVVELHSNAYFMLMFRVSCQDDPIFKNFSCKAFNHIMVMVQTDFGIAKFTQALNSRSKVTQFLFASHYNLKTTHQPDELAFQLNFWYILFNLCDNKENSAIDLICNAELKQEHVDMIIEDIGEHKLFKDGLSFTSGADFLVIQLMTIFDYSFCTKMNVDTKHEIKALSFQCLKLLFKKSEKARKFFEENGLILHVATLVSFSIKIMQNYRYLETNKKNGAQKTGYMIKDLIILLKAFLEWKLPLEKHQKLVADFTVALSNINDWLEADTILMNNFYNLLRVVMSMQVGGEQLTVKDSKTLPLVKKVFKKIKTLSHKAPHTETTLAMIRNALHWLMACAQFVDARIVLKNQNVFTTFEKIHPHLNFSRKTTWDNVAVEWLHFFEFLSRFDDMECRASHVSEFCRIIRVGNPNIRASALRVIRNASRSPSVSVVLLNSDEFKSLVNDIITFPAINQEKSLILQTLLSVGGHSEQGKAKLKNSPLNRKLKDQLDQMRLDPSLPRSDSFACVFNLAEMLRALLDHQ